MIVIIIIVITKNIIIIIIIVCPSVLVSLERRYEFNLLLSLTNPPTSSANMIYYLVTVLLSIDV